MVSTRGSRAGTSCSNCDPGACIVGGSEQTEYDRPRAGPNPSFITRASGLELSWRRRLPDTLAASDRPLVIAIHGETYTSAHFDVAGHSLLDRAQTFDVPIIAIDRPDYEASADCVAPVCAIARNAAILDVAIDRIRRDAGHAQRGIVLIGQSIGGAVTLAIAARQPAWPLLGVAVSGVGLTPIPGSAEQWAALPELPAVSLPGGLKDEVMFGPDGTFDARTMPAASHAADAPVPRAELIDIVSGWPGNVRALAARVTVPVHYRQAEFDRLWVTNAGEVRGFGAAFTNAPWVSAELYPTAGHCIDFHDAGEAFQIEQLAFALRCAAVSAQPR